MGIRLSKFGGGWIDDGPDLGDAVGGKAALACVFAHHLLIGRDVDAIDFVVRHVAVQPLNLGPKVA